MRAWKTRRECSISVEDRLGVSFAKARPRGLAIITPVSGRLGECGAIFSEDCITATAADKTRWKGEQVRYCTGLLESVARTRKAGPEPSVTRLLLLLAEMWSASYIIRIQKPGVPESIAWVGTRRCTAPGRTQDTIT